MVYQRKDMFEEDKWNIHSSSYRQEKYGSSESGEKSETDAKYKHEQYGIKKEKDIYKANEEYHKKEEEEQRKEKEEEESKEPGIEDAVKEEEKQKAEEEEKDVFKVAAHQLSQEFQQDSEKNVKPKKKGIKSIEEAIDKAIKEEKETIIVDH